MSANRDYSKDESLKELMKNKENWSSAEELGLDLPDEEDIEE